MVFKLNKDNTNSWGPYLNQLPDEYQSIINWENETINLLAR